MLNRIKSFIQPRHSFFAPEFSRDAADRETGIALSLAELPMSQLVPALADLTTTRSSDEWTLLLKVTEQRGLDRLAAVLRYFLPMASASKN